MPQMGIKRLLASQNVKKNLVHVMPVRLSSLVPMLGAAKWTLSKFTNAEKAWTLMFIVVSAQAALERL